MLEGVTAHTWPIVVRVLAQNEPLRMVVQMYSADDELPAPFMPAAAPQWLETVTTFDEDADKPVSSEPVDIDEALLHAVGELDLDALDIECDFAVFRPGEHAWLAAAVPHEEMVLVKEGRHAEALSEAGLAVSAEPPDWW